MTSIASFVKDLAKKLICWIPLKWIRRFLGWKFGYADVSFSPDGEDLILKNILKEVGVGFYVDIGAYHPIRFSNTYSLYVSGWHGLNIDAMPGSMEEFNRKRPRDINIEAAISDKNESMTYHLFDEQAFNTFSNELAERYIQDGQRRIGQKQILTERLSEILGKHLPENQKIDLMTIDVEGYDINVLQSNDWNKYRPKFIMIEELGFDAENPDKSDIYAFLKGNGYRLVIATPKNIFFEDTERK